MDKLLKPKEVADKLQVSISCIYKKAELNKIDCIKIGSALRFTKQSVDEYIEKCKRKTEE